MPFLGSIPATGYTTLVKQDLTPDGATAAFTLTIPSTTEGAEVFVNNVRQEPGSAYNVSGTTLTFTSTPANTDSIYVVFQGGVRESTTIPFANSITTTMLVDGSITAAKIANGTVVESEIANGAVTVEKMTIDGHLIPTANITYDLGSSTSRFRDLYLSGTTIELGDQTISSNATHVSMGTAKFSSVGIDDNATNTAITIDTNGSVGIGKTPNYSTSVLQLSRNSNNSYLSIDGLLSTVYLGTGADQNALYSQDANSGPKDFIFVQGTSTAMLIDSDSRVTIGTGATPATGAVKLKVETTGSDNCIQQLVCNTGAVELQMNRGDGDATNIGHNGTVGYVQTENSTDLAFYIDSSPVMTIDATGDVGIGNQDPNSGTFGAAYRHLDIQSTGTSGAGSIRLASSDDSYVFRIGGAASVGARLGTYTNNTLDFYTNSLRRTRLTTTGDFLINDTSNALTGSSVGSRSLFKVTGDVGSTQIAETGNQIAFSRNAANYISATGSAASLHYDSKAHYIKNGSEDLIVAATNSITGNKFLRTQEIQWEDSNLRESARYVAIASYWTSGEYVEICEIAPGGASQNYEIRAELTAATGQTGEKVDIIVRFRSNTLPTVVWNAAYHKERIGTSFGLTPYIWHDSSTGTIKLVVKSGANIHNADFKVRVQGRTQNQGRDNVTISDGSEIYSIPSGYTEYSINEISNQYWNSDFAATRQSYEPCISGQIGTAMTNPSGPTKLSFNQFWVQQGGLTYDSNTSRFTVPIAGRYRITMNPFKITGVGATRVLIGVNTDTPTTSGHYGHTYSNDTNYHALMLDSVVDLSANDYIVFYLNAGQLYNQSSDRFNQFSIQFIG